MLLEKRYENGLATLKDLEKDSKSFADTKVEVEHSREQYKTAVVSLIFDLYQIIILSRKVPKWKASSQY